jgi:hypothetical protein
LTTALKSAIITDIVSNTNKPDQEQIILLDVVDLAKLHHPNGTLHPETGEHMTPMEAANLIAENMGSIALISWSHESVAEHNSGITRQRSRERTSSVAIPEGYRVALVAKKPDEGQRVMYRIIGKVPQPKPSGYVDPAHANPFEK